MNNGMAEIDTFITDIGFRAGNEFSYLLLALVTEGTIQ